MSEQQKALTVPAGALTPEGQAYINQSIASAVGEAMKQAMAGFTSVLQSVALTPERIQELKKPYEDPARAARDARDRQQFRAQVEEQQRNDAAKKKSCLHRHKTGMEALQLVHNFPDRQPRATCSLCQDWIYPKEWRIGAPTREHPLGKAYVAAPHKDYARVIALENGQTSPIDTMTPVTFVGEMQQQ